MNPTDIPGDAAIQTEPTTTNDLSSKRHQAGSYQKVYDGRKQPVRGLWKRNGVFIARFTETTPDDGKKSDRFWPLKDAKTVPQAIVALNKLKQQARDKALPVLRMAPKLSEYIGSYLKHQEKCTDKRASTIAKEKSSLVRWKEAIGDVRLNAINKSMIKSFMAKRQEAEMSGRTVNLDVIALRNVLKSAIDDGWIRSLPMENLRPLKWVAKKRELITSAAIEKLCETAVGKNDDGSPVTKNAQQFCDYVRLMAFCGSRRDETLRLKWDDVNWERKQLTIGADGLSKNYTSRVVDFNPDLESHLRSMEKRRQPDSKWLFPSPQRGEKDQHAKTFKESLNLSRAKAGVPNFNFHDCRHYFISHAVMAGVDFMTIAAWVGHQDGGVLIGKVYGHLADEHKKRMANQLVFTPRIVEAPATTVPRSNARESIEEQEGRGSSDVPAANEN